MADSMGLLDFLQTPAGQGLLSAGFSGLAGARRGQPVNNVGRAGMAGLLGYNQAQQNQAEAANDTQRSRLFDMQVQQMQEQQARQKAAEELAQRQSNYIGSIGKVTSPVIGAEPNKLDPYKAYAMGIPADMVKALAEAPNLGRSKVARTIESTDSQGNPVTLQRDEYGDPVGSGLSKYVAPVQVNQGNKISFVTPRNGVSLGVGMSPVNYDKAKDSADAATGVTYQQDANGNLVALPKNVKPGSPVSPIPVMDQAGQQMQGKGSPKASFANQYSVVKSALTEVKKLIPDATSSGIGAARDTAAGFFGKTTDAANAAAKLDTYGAWLSSNVPRFEGPQSDADRLYYAQMAGNIGNRKVPVEQRLAAVQALEKFMDERAKVYGINTNQTPSQTSGGASVSNW